MFQFQRTPPRRPPETDSMSLLDKSLEKASIPGNVRQNIECARRESSRKQYKGHGKNAKDFCDNNLYDPVQPKVAEALGFLQMMIDAGKSYSCVNLARSALSVVFIMSN